MTDSPTISKAAPPFTSMDFAALRQIGISHFEKMGTRLWTDFNLHDPGITILEVLCYAITDLGYRTNFPIEDIIASTENGQAKEHFFSASDILSCNPVTANDFRKILIDLEGIKNAWVVKTVQQEMPLFASEIEVKDKENNSKQEWSLGFNSAPNAHEVKLNGLYDVYIDLDGSIDLNDLDRVNDITLCAWRQLRKHRNLCEDFVTIKLVEEMEFGIEAEIELCPDADVNKVAGDIYYYIQEFLTPTIQFYSFKELYEDKGKSCEEIFEGPVLCNGFIDDTELDKAQLRREIYVSDLWQVIMDVCGVAGIRNLKIHKCVDSQPITNDGKNWCLKIDPYFKPRLSRNCSQISFQKEFECVFADSRKVSERIALLQKLNQPRRKSQKRPLLPPGTNRNLGEYFTIQSEFPATYKIGEGQILDTDSTLRKAQVKQLKAYLLLFDKLMANYLVQLEKVKDLLSVSQAEEHTYFFQTLYTIPGIRDLIKDANRLQITDQAIKAWQTAKLPEPLLSKLQEMGMNAIFNGEKDLAHKLSLALYEEYVKPQEQAIMDRMGRNDKGEIFLEKKENEDELIREDIWEILVSLANESFRDEKSLLKAIYIAYFRDKYKKYYTQILSHLKALPASEESWSEFVEDDKNNFLTGLGTIVETETRRKQRKNIFLDHLLARFGESFSDYVVKAYQEQCLCTSPRESISVKNDLLKQKMAFLQRIPELSSERGKGFNYKALDCGNPDVWDTLNVAGLKKRVSMYLGFEDYKRKTLTCSPEFSIVPYRVIVEGRVQNHRLRMLDKDGNELLDGIKDYYRQQAAVKEAKELRELVLRGKIYKSEPDPKTGYVRVYLKDKEDNNALQSKMMTDAEAGNLIKTIKSLAFPDTCAIEGFHIVEHILLRPKDDDYGPLFHPVKVLDTQTIKWNSISGEALPVHDIIIHDPYSFWITVVVPDWLPQFKNDANAQHRFEQLVRRECPAHILVKFSWMTPEQMYQFESAYLQWLYENALEEPNERELTVHVNDLVEFMKDFEYSIRDIGDPCLGMKTKKIL